MFGSDKDCISNSCYVSGCAFRFGIDKSSVRFYDNPLEYIGMKIIEFATNYFRCIIYGFNLPFGDQCLSFRKSFFDYIGGFPDQCLLEDYDLVSFLGKRTKTLGCNIERLEIIPGNPALCSPRRWLKLGVFKTTMTNSKIIKAHAGGMDPDELFQTYYRAKPPVREYKLAKWERTLT